MPNPFGRLMEAIATANSTDLRRQVQFLRAENQILQSGLKRQVRTTPRSGCGWCGWASRWARASSR